MTPEEVTNSRKTRSLLAETEVQTDMKGTIFNTSDIMVYWTMANYTNTTEKYCIIFILTCSCSNLFKHLGNQQLN